MSWCAHVSGVIHCKYQKYEFINTLVWVGFRIEIGRNEINVNESYIRGWAFAYLESTKCYNTKRSMWRSVEDTRRSVEECGI